MSYQISKCSNFLAMHIMKDMPFNFLNTRFFPMPHYRVPNTSDKQMQKFFSVFLNISWSLGSMLQAKLFHWPQYALCTSHDLESNFVQRNMVCRYVYTCVCMWVSLCIIFLDLFPNYGKFLTYLKVLSFLVSYLGPQPNLLFWILSLHTMGLLFMSYE